MTGDRVLVTGAGGFVASHLAAGLAALGHQVTAVDIAFDAATQARLSGVALVEADVARGEAALRDLPAAQIVVHGAALTTDPAALGITAAEHVAANTLPLLGMLQHAARVRPRAFVFLSSSGVFGEGDGSPDLTEADRPTAQGPYSAAKRAGEALVPGALGGACATHVLRLGYLYGPAEAPRRTRARVSMLQAWVEAARDGAVLRVAENDPRRDWTFVPDLAPALARLLDGPGSPWPRHLCAPAPAGDSRLAAAIAARIPGARVERGPAVQAKPPMVPGVFPELAGFRWTTLEEGLDRLCGQDVLA